MADFQTCYSWMLDNEDAQREYAVVSDVGGEAISGINSASFPEDYSVIESTPQANRGPLVQAFYQKHFWNVWLAQIESDEVAKRVFDASVNMGSVPAVKCLQKAVELAESGHGSAIQIDGLWGPITVALVNQDDESQLVEAFQEERANHYRAIVAADPSKSVYLTAWLSRAEK
jgi:lysozyme family protein